ncbi:related to C.carbonum toxD protein, partial [Phialocephala subalpina]
IIYIIFLILLRSDEILVRVKHVALNPVDWKSIDLSPAVGATWGCDFSGEVVKIGSSVGAVISVGDAVCGCTLGNNHDDGDNGAFAEFVVVASSLAFKVPVEMSLQQAATLGIGLSTVGLALNHTLGLPLPRASAVVPTDAPHLLIYGGATATGTLAIQMARLSGFSPVVTCSPHSFALVKSLGAIEAFDYQSPSCGIDIQTYTHNSLQYAMDCITDTRSMKTCYTAIGKGGGKYVSLDPFPIRGHTRRNIKPQSIVAFTMYGKAMTQPFKRDARPQDRKFAEMWYQHSQKLLDLGKITPHPHEENPGGLEGVIAGADRGRKGQISGVKLVYSMWE